MTEERVTRGSWGPGRRRIFRSLLFFGCAFLVISALVHATLRDPLRMHADIRSEKMAILDQWQGKAYSAMFGSSHIHDGFDPRTFDQELASSPLATRSINLAVAGGSQTEQRAMALEFVRHMRPPAQNSTGEAGLPRACMVLLELSAGANFTTDHLVHPRAINIYDWQTARFAMDLTSPKMSRMQRIGRQGYALLAMSMHYLNVGMLSSQIFSPPLNTGLLKQETEDDRRGIHVSPVAGGASMAGIEGFIRESPKMATPEQGELDPGNSDLVEELLTASSVRPLQAVYVVWPKLSDLQQMPTYPPAIEAGGQTVPIINLARPDKFPQIYDSRNWHDDAHLDVRGARIATRLLADQLKTWFGAHGAPARCGS